MKNMEYQDSIRSTCKVELSFWSRIMLLFRGEFTVDVRIDTENICGKVSDAEFGLTIEPLIKRKPSVGQAEINPE